MMLNRIERDQHIVCAAIIGERFQDIADRFGLSQRRVQQVVVGRGAPVPLELPSCDGERVKFIVSSYCAGVPISCIGQGTALSSLDVQDVLVWAGVIEPPPRRCRVTRRQADMEISGYVSAPEAALRVRRRPRKRVNHGVIAVQATQTRAIAAR